MNAESPSHLSIENIFAMVGVAFAVFWVLMWVINLFKWYFSDTKAPILRADAQGEFTDIVERSSDWSHDEAMHLRRFLETPTGKTFLARARKIEARTAVIGAHDLMHSAHSAGVTVGFGDCLNWIESLASDTMISDSVAVSTEQQTADADKDGSEPVEPRRHF